MLPAKASQTSNLQISQLTHLFGNNLFDKKYNMDWIFNKININCKVENSSYAELLASSWIGYTALHFAVNNLDIKAFDVLLYSGADFTEKNSNNFTALHQFVIEFSDTEAHTFDFYFVHSVLSAHFKNNNFENPVNDYGLSHFHIACAANNVDVVKGFLKNGVSVDHTVKADCSLFPGFSPLHFAVRYCADEAAKVLLSYGANVHIKDYKGMTPLQKALQMKLKIIEETNIDQATSDQNEKILIILLEKESNNETLVIDDMGLSHFHVACTFRDPKVSESYLQKVMDINHIVNLDSPRWAGYTASHFAALCNINTVKLLVTKGANINIKNANGVTAFDICVEKYGTREIFEIIYLDPVLMSIMLADGKTKLAGLVFAMTSLTQFNTYITRLSKTYCNSDSLLWPGYSPMHLVVKLYKNSSHCHKKLQILRRLFEQNPSMLHSKDVDCHTPLHLAFLLNKKRVLNHLFGFLESCTNLIDHEDKDGLSYIHIASAKNKLDVLEKLLAAGDNVNAIYKGDTLDSPKLHSGMTPLHLAVINEKTEAVEILVMYGADVYAKDENGMTPIHMVLSNNRKKLVDVLLSSPNLKDSVVNGIGLSHLHIACLRGKHEVVTRLLADGADINGIITYQQDEDVEFSKLSFLQKYAGFSPLLFVIQHDRYGIINLLLERGADVFVKNTKGMPLLYDILQGRHNDIFDYFAIAVTKSEILQARLKTEIGMTKLHFACLNVNINVVDELLKEKINVNVQINANSPIFQGFTPLHIVMYVSVDYDAEYVDKLIKLLLKAGADVTLQAANKNTVVHMAYKLFNQKSKQSYEQEESNYNHVITLLNAQRNFLVNPVCVEGISHFHIACDVCNTNIVQKFLNNCNNIDIDQPIDYFVHELPGYTCLHLVASRAAEKCGASKQLHTIDLLLNYGANVHVVDARGDTPLHRSTRCKSLDVFERLIRSGADANARNTRGETPLNSLLSSDYFSAAKVRVLLKCGCHVNDFNPVTSSGSLGKIVCKLPYENVQDLLSALIVNFRQELATDSLDQTIIHNLVSENASSISALQYAELIEMLSGIECDIDDQDYFGQTALHMAVKFHNYKAVSGLLMAGADVNIIDYSGRTAFAYNIGSCPECSNRNENTNGVHPDCEYLLTLKVLAIHVIKLQLCQLYVNQQNENFVFQAFVKLQNEHALTGEFFRELETIKTTYIGPHSLTLYDFLSEYGSVADYPIMSQIKRNDIDEFFSPGEVKSFRQKFPELAAILQLQYRKARARPELVESAKDGLALIIGFRLPEICFHSLLILLSNSDLKSLIDSTTA